MNYKKILTLSIILAIAISFAIVPAFANTKTTKIYFKKDDYVYKKIGPEPYDRIYTYYCSKKHNHENNHQRYALQTNINMDFEIDSYNPIKYELVNAKITFTKNIRGKKYYSVKSFKAKKTSPHFFIKSIHYNAKKGYKPYYAIVKYKKLKEEQYIYLI